MSANTTATSEATNATGKPRANTTGSTQRANKPRPLVLNGAQDDGGARGPPGNYPRGATTPLNLDQVLELMASVNAAVRAGQFTAALGHQIGRLCAQLKISGECLEISHKPELNRVFVSLRQACCRDSGALGTSCRLKIMELVELRAMGWRASLSHSQYYLNRAPGGGSTPVSAPPFGAVPINPFGAPPPNVPMQVQGVDNQSYYLVPATAGLGYPSAGAWFPPNSPQFNSSNGSIPQTPMSASLPEPSPLVDTPWPRNAAVKTSGRQPRPVKVPGKNQFRYEIIIRNADSGKIMGVRGRRVAVVEELSNTVISFQKVASASAKDRALTITGTTEEQLEHARLLIEETIKRNVSPNRPDTEGLPIDDYVADDDDDAFHDDPPADVRRKATGDDLNIRFEKTGDGSLRLSCDDPLVLQAAQDALSQYFVRKAPARRSQKDLYARHERRKSLPSASNEDDEKHERKVSQADKDMNWRSNKDGEAGANGVPEPLVAAKYTRDYLVQLNTPADAQLTTTTVESLRERVPDILRVDDKLDTVVE